MSKRVIKNGVDLGEFVSKSGAWVTYISDDGRTLKARGASVQGEQTNTNQESNVATKTKAKTKSKGKAKAKAKSTNGEVAVRKCKDATFQRFETYVRHKTPNGTFSYDNGDKVASTLRDLTLDEVYKEVAKATREEGVTIADQEATLRKRYGKLNAGMQRMNLGNRLRAVL